MAALPLDSILFLREYPQISSKTIDELVKQEVTKKMFLDLTLEDLRINFSEIIYAQKVLLHEIIEKLVVPDSADITNPNASKSSNPSRDVSSVSDAVRDTIASSSQVDKPNRVKDKKMVQKKSEKDIEPLDIISMLSSKKKGQDVIQSIREKQTLTRPNQVAMMGIIHKKVLVGNSPEKYYPDADVKVAVAKGIVKDFPELRDDGERDYVTMLEKFENKCQSVRDALPPEKKKPRLASSSSSTAATSSVSCLSTSAPSSATCASTSTTSSATCPSTSTTSSSTCSTGTDDSLTDALTKWMKETQAKSSNQRQLSTALKDTFEARQRWVQEKKPSCTEIIRMYPHLIGFKGDMLSEEFNRMEPNHTNFEESFQEVGHFIWAHFKKIHPECIEDIEEKFEDVNIRALVVLPKLLRSYYSKKNTSADQLDHIKNKKSLLEQIPSTALIQIVPENTCIESYISIEYRSEALPIPPFIVWATTNKRSGEVYLKADRQSIYVASFEDRTVSSPLVKAVKCLIEASFVFNLEYHPYLRHTYQFLECLFGITKPSLLNVKSLNAAIRELKNK